MTDPTKKTKDDEARVTTKDPRDTDHAAGDDQAAENRENDSPG